MIERVNKEVRRHLRFICLDRRFGNKWSSMLPLVQRSINAQLREVVGVEPARIVFGGFQTMDRFLLPDTIPLIPFLVQCSRVLQPSQQKDRRLVVGEYLKYLVDTQLEAVIVKCAQIQRNTITSTSRVEFEKLRLLRLSITTQVILGACAVAVAGITSRADASNAVKSMLERYILHRCCKRVDSTGYPSGSD
jgi:hypothetical protein